MFESASLPGLWKIDVETLEICDCRIVERNCGIFVVEVIVEIRNVIGIARNGDREEWICGARKNFGTLLSERMARLCFLADFWC